MRAGRGGDARYSCQSQLPILPEDEEMQKIAMIGFGNVGQGLADILVEKKVALKRGENYEFAVVAISDFKLG